jgi:O-acetyl-ADP-ribose deacetylase (regulator of RNase III)
VVGKEMANQGGRGGGVALAIGREGGGEVREREEEGAL